MAASSRGLPSFDNEVLWGLLALMHPLSAFGCLHRWSSLPALSTLELVSYSRVTSRMQTLRGVCTTSRRPKSYHDLRQCHTLDSSVQAAAIISKIHGPGIQASYPAAEEARTPLNDR
ncbi:hypothetical protein COCVIDRAFT_34953 [Bipolaris victoriae FI3]|uniref:Uncharacterized protein n=1 Tax=Bipolaris victoriae (strain FI3) TaxID=930091 RepID=W7ET55_BIPV3|nr:hypothetical protein COCVIDRAFT_34953 [Bipolaris victoriae FI3]